jgi:alkanesulfonate monooxygenase SsuD/methylene tetrahydromethanopterin reductase-like flavin-dependent oxidoreductase (luciferase family)
VQKPHPPLLIGGQGPKLILPVIARHANIWHLRVRDVEPQGIKQLCANFDAICRQVGRDPAEVERAVSLRSAQLAEPAAAVRRQIQALADVGIRHFILSLSPADRKLLDRFAKEVMPALRET